MSNTIEIIAREKAVFAHVPRRWPLSLFLGPDFVGGQIVKLIGGTTEPLYLDGCSAKYQNCPARSGARCDALVLCANNLGDRQLFCGKMPYTQILLNRARSITTL